MSAYAGRDITNADDQSAFTLNRNESEKRRAQIQAMFDEHPDMHEKFQSHWFLDARFDALVTSSRSYASAKVNGDSSEIPRVLEARF